MFLVIKLNMLYTQLLFLYQYACIVIITKHHFRKGFCCLFVLVLVFNGIVNCLKLVKHYCRVDKSGNAKERYYFTPHANSSYILCQALLGLVD